LEEIPFALDTELGIPRIFTLRENQAGLRLNHEIGRVQALLMRSVDGIGDAQDPSEKVEGLLLILGQILISTMGWGGDAFTVVASQQSYEISLCLGKLLPRVFPDDSG
jgi:hypothetical protein